MAVLLSPQGAIVGASLHGSEGSQRSPRICDWRRPDARTECNKYHQTLSFPGESYTYNLFIFL